MLDNIQLDQEEDVDPPVELFNWGAGGMKCILNDLFISTHTHTHTHIYNIIYVVTPAQRADIANLFANMSTFATSQSFHQHPPVLPVAGNITFSLDYLQY